MLGLPLWVSYDRMHYLHASAYNNGAGGRIVSKIKSVASCEQFSQGVPENPGQTPLANL